MNEYLTLEGGHLLTIMLPTSFIISKIIFFLKAYINNSSKIVKNFNYIIVFFTTISSIIIYIVDFGMYFTVMWFTVFTVSLIQYNLSNSNVEYCYTENPNSFGIVRNIVSIILGIIVLSIPHTKIFFMIGGGGDPRVDFVSKILLHTYGILLILLDNHTLLIYNKFIRKSNPNKF